MSSTASVSWTSMFRSNQSGSPVWNRACPWSTCPGGRRSDGTGWSSLLRRATCSQWTRPRNRSLSALCEGSALGSGAKWTRSPLELVRNRREKNSVHIVNGLFFRHSYSRSRSHLDIESLSLCNYQCELCVEMRLNVTRSAMVASNNKAEGCGFESRRFLNILPW